MDGIFEMIGRVVVILALFGATVMGIAIAWGRMETELPPEEEGKEEGGEF